MPTDEEKEKEPTEEKKKEVVLLPPEINSLALIGDITEETANDVIFSFLLLSERNTAEYLSSVLSMDETDVEELKPNIDFYISTNGGSADEMFGIYDIMRMVKEEGASSLTTYGIGKVMSAGVLLLAAGTKGKRRVGKHCRIMLHSVIGATTGPMHQLENEFAEVKKIQDTYIKALVEETDMTEKYLRSLLKKKTNIYLTAEKAVDLGIADEIF